jgi:hypothetical protein
MIAPLKEAASEKIAMCPPKNQKPTPHLPCKPTLKWYIPDAGAPKP